MVVQISFVLRMSLSKEAYPDTQVYIIFLWFLPKTTVLFSLKTSVQVQTSAQVQTSEYLVNLDGLQMAATKH